MATPLTATARITLQYVVDGFLHKLRAYVAYNLVLGVPQLNDRDGITTVQWQLGAQNLWDHVRAVLNTSAVPAPATATLESRAGALWNPVVQVTLTGAGSQGGTYFKASEATWVLRDTAFKKIRFIILEWAFGYAYHSATGASTQTEIQGISDGLSGANVGANEPYRWMKSRGDRFLLATGDIAGLTLDLNDKLKRARFLA